MNQLARNAVLSLAVASTTLAALPPAEAAERWRDRRPAVEHRQDDTGALIAAGILGLAVGAIAAGIVAGGRPPADPASVNPYRQPRPQPDRDYFPPAPGNARYHGAHQSIGGMEPWTREWYRYCTRRYRSFDPSTGTYIGRSGEERFCLPR